MKNKIWDEKFSYILNQMLYSLFSFSVSLFCARTLSIKDFGEFSYAYSFIPLLNILPLAFIYFPMMNFFSKWEKNQEDYILNNAKLNIIFSCLLSIVLSLVLYLTNTLTNTIILFVMFYILYQFYEFARRLFIVKQEIKTLNLLELFKLIIFIALILCLIFFNYNKVRDILIGLSILMLIINIIAYSISKIKLVNENNFSKIINESYAFGKWIFLSNIVQNLSSNFFIYISAFILSSESIGRLNAPKIFLGITTVFLLSMDNYYTPKLALKRLKKKIFFKNELINIIKELRYFYLLFFITSLTLIYYQDFVIGIIFGNKYTVGENYLWGFVLVGLLYSLNRPFLILIRVFEDTKFLFKSSVWVLCFVLFLTYPLMRLYGAFGGLIVMILASLLQFIIFLTYLKLNDKTIS